MEVVSPVLGQPFHDNLSTKTSLSNKSGKNVLKKFKKGRDIFLKLKPKKPGFLADRKHTDTDVMDEKPVSTHRNVAKFLDSVRKLRERRHTYNSFHKSKPSNLPISLNLNMTVSKKDIEDFVYNSCTGEMAEMYQDYGEIVDEIGGGAGGKVYLLERKKDNNLFALKIHNGFLSDYDVSYGEFREKLMQEIFLSLTLNHFDFVGHTYAVFIDRRNDRFYQVMDYYHFDMFSYVSDIMQDSDASMYKITKSLNSLFVSVVKSVSVLHRIGVAHRDLKLENICVDQDAHIRIIDFGCAKCSFVTASSPAKRNHTYSVCDVRKPPTSKDSIPGPHCPLLSTSGLFSPRQAKPIYVTDVSGTAPYIPPEEHMPGIPYDALKADVWALGVIFVALHTARFPWARAAARLDANYAQYVQKRTLKPMFRRYCRTGLSLDDESELALLRMLEPNPRDRASLTELVSSQWFKGL